MGYHTYGWIGGRLISKPQRGEIWLVDLNPTKGREQSGVRPVLIISDNNFNSGSSELTIVLPITIRTM